MDTSQVSAIDMYHCQETQIFMSTALSSVGINQSFVFSRFSCLSGVNCIYTTTLIVCAFSVFIVV